MRIAIVYLGRRGAGGAIGAEIAHQLMRNHQVTAVLSRALENLQSWDHLLQRMEVDTYRNAAGAILSLVFPVQVCRLAGQIRRLRPDVVFFPMFHPWNFLIQTILREIPSVIIVHDPRPHPDLAGRFYEKLENLSIRRASRCVILSETLKSHLVARGMDAARIDVIPLGPLSYSTRRPSQTKRLPTALFFGRIVPYKGLDTLLEAFASLRTFLNCQLILAGEGNLAPHASALANLANLEIINRWIAEEEVGDLFARSDLVVLPYTSASQSGVIPIAAAFGLPVVATRTGGLVEQLEDGVSGWLVEAGNAQALAAAMREALSAPEEARRRGAALKSRYATQFSWEQFARRLEQSLEMASRPRGST